MPDSIKLTIDIILYILDKKWGDGQFYDLENFPFSNAEYRKSKDYRCMIDQLVKEKFVDKRGGKCVGRVRLGNIYIGKREYCNLLLRITAKGHEYAVNQRIKESNNQTILPQDVPKNPKNNLSSIDKIELKDCVGKDKHREAIDRLKLILTKCEDKNINELIMIESQLTRIEKDKTTGTESHENIDLRLNKVSKGLLTIIDSIE